MEGGRGLASLIRELQGEIKKLENENRALRGQLSRPSSGSQLPVPVEPQHGEENSSTAQLRRNVSAPALEAQFKNMIMTVRRYSISSNTITVPQKGDTTNTSSSSSSSSVFSRPSRADSSSAKETLSSKRSLQQCVNQTARVKTVTFLLPVEDIYTNRPVLANHVPNRSSQDLNAIMETDS
uniref:Si:ch211-235m3.10 n=1 Tax=Astyanax mexicanus TaxID=7994 RepID=A0A3B1K1G3_ASTMX